MSFFDAIRIFIHRAGYRIFIIFFLILFGGFMEMMGVSLIAPVLSAGTPSPDGDSIARTLHALFNMFGVDPNFTMLLSIMVVAFLIKSLLMYIQLVYTSYTQTEIRKDLQKEIIDLYSRINFKSHQSQSSGYVNNIIMREVPRFLQSFMEFTRIPVSFVHSLVYIGLALVIDWITVVLLLGIGVLVFLAIRPIVRKSRETSLEVSDHAGVLQSSIVEYIQNILYFRSTGSVLALQEKLNHSINKFGGLELRVSILSAIVKVMNEPIAVTFLAGVLYFNVEVQGKSVAEMLVIGFLLYRLLSRILQLQGEWQRFCSAAGGLEIVNRSLEDFKKSQEKTGLEPVKAFDPKISFKEVSVFHQDRKILNRVTLDIPSNKSIGIVGPSGAGKTTFFNVLTGLLDAEEGQITVGSQNFKTLSKNNLREKIGFVPQDPVILNETMLNNIVLWRLDTSQPKTIDRVHKAMKEAGCEKLIPKLNDTLGERGIRLSGGEKQRLAIARELMKKPSLLIMDEATSALDSYSEEIVQDSINKLKGKCTILLIAHRLSTVVNCDLIYVFKDGTVVESGSFYDLYSRDETFFSSMCKKQGINL